MTISILQWNINGYHNNYNELLLLIDRYFPDIICLQETHIPFNCFSTPVPKSYTGFFYNLRISSSKKGIAFLVKSQIPHSLLSNHDTFLSSTLQLNINLPLKIVNCYIPPDVTLHSEDLYSIFNGTHPPFILLGDFNGWSPLWGSTQINKRGSIIENFIADQNIALLNNGKPTHFSTHNTFTNIDLTFCSPNLLPNCDWRVLDDLCGSDHFPILTNIASSLTFGKTISIRKFKTDQANWNLFGSICEDRFKIWNFKNINHEVAMISKTIRYAANISIPQTKGGPIFTRTCWWNSNLSHLRSRKTEMWKVFKRTPNIFNLIEYKKSNSVFKRKVKEAKALSFEKFTSQINPSLSSSQIWTKINSITRPPSAPIQSINVNGVSLNSPLQISTAFAKMYSANSSDDNFSEEYCRQKNSISSHTHISSKLSSVAKRIEGGFTTLELTIALKSSKGKTPGLDRISYPMIQHLPSTAISKILFLYNNIFSSGLFPHMWKNAAVVFIPKPNKPKEDIRSYRPISLLPCLSKIYEKMVARRLLWFLCQSKRLSPNQTGFRSGQGTTDALLELQHAAFDALSTKNHLSVLSVDFEKAFDRVGAHIVLERMASWGVGPKIFNMVKEFMSNRKFQVKLQNTLSSSRPLFNGIPQGSPLSVVLFLIAFNDISNIINKFKGFDHRLYADDLIVYTKIKNLTIVKDNFSQMLFELKSWGLVSGAKLALEKCKTFHICNKQLCSFPKVSLNNVSISHAYKLSILGIWFDSKLTFKHHCTEVRKKLFSRLNIIKLLSSKHSGIHSNILINTIKALILSKIDYGLPIYGWCAKSNIQLLFAPYHAAIRRSCYAFKTSPISCLLIETGMPHILDRVQSNTIKLIPKFFQSQNSLLHSSWNKALSNKRTFKKLSTLRRCLVFCKKMCIPCRIPPLSPTIPCWLLDPTSIILDLHTFHKNSTPPDVFLKLFLEKYNNYVKQGWNFIYTDGSKNNDITTFASVADDKTLIHGGWLPPSSSVFTAEAMAIKISADFALLSRKKYIICTDSLAVANAVSCGITTSPLITGIRALIFKNPNRLKILWVPGHVGIPGNEAADQAAKSAISSPMHTFHSFETNDLKRTIISHINDTPLYSHKIDDNHYYRAFNPTLSQVTFPDEITRLQAGLFTRLRIGHTRLSHTHLIDRSYSPFCPLCGKIGSPLHILDECSKLSVCRYTTFSNVLPSSLLSNPSVSNIIKITNFLQKNHVAHLI